MNIESLISKVKLFNDLVIDSGFRRDVQDYSKSIQQAQNQNLVFMKDLSSKIYRKINEFKDNSLQDELTLLLRVSDPFIAEDYIGQIDEIDEDPEIEATTYYQKFHAILTSLINGIDQNKNEIDEVNKVFEEYVSSQDEYDTSEDQAILSLVLKDLKTTKSLKEFSKVLDRWNRTILIYHTLLKSESPEDVSLVQVQNGSIDVIFNIDFDVAVDLTEVLKTGIKVYSAYLLYKTTRAKEIIASYMGNRKLIKMEKDREKLMLDNIKESIAKKIEAQHKERVKTDRNIEKAGYTKKVDEVSKVISDHIIKGNELKLLTPPEVKDDEEKDLSVQLREETSLVRERYKKLSGDEKKMLLDKYSIKDEETQDQ